LCPEAMFFKVPFNYWTENALGGLLLKNLPKIEQD